MKIKKLIAYLLLALSAISLMSFYSTSNASPGHSSFQEEEGSNPGADNENTANKNKNNRNKNSRNANNANLNNRNDDNITRNTEKEQKLKSEKGKLQERADKALKKAQAVASNSNDPDVQKSLKKLSDDVERVNSLLDKVATLEALGPLKDEVNGIEESAQNIEDMVASSSPGFLTLSNIVSLTSLLLAFISLITLGFLFFNFRSRFNQLDVAYGRSHQSIEKLKQVLSETKKYAESVGANLSRVQDDLGLKIESAKRNSEEAKKMARSLESAPASVEPLRAEQRLEPVDPEPSFPALVSDYLNRIKGNRKKGLEADFRTNTLVPTTDGSAPFMFVEDIDGSGAGIVLPKPRLQRSQEFSSYYKGYYYCNEPSAGEVYIVEPAIVEREGNGWRLRHMGRMEIR